MIYNKNSEIEIIANRIQNKINSYYLDADRNSVKIKGRHLGGKGTAKTFRFKIDFGNNGLRKIIFVKFSPVYGKNNMGRMEYDALCLLHPKMPLVDPHCNVPRPIDFYDDINAILIEEVKGISFRDYLRRRNSLFSSKKSIFQLCSVVFNCGKWLRVFHTLTMEDKEKFFLVSEFSSSFGRELENLERSGFNQSTINSIKQLLKEMDSLRKVFSMPLAMWHFDFTPGHVFVNNGDVSVIDIFGIKETSIYEDIGHWLASMSVVNNLPWYLFFDYSAANGILCEKFLNGYFPEEYVKREESFLLAYLYKLKYLIISFYEQDARVCDVIHPLAAKLYSKLKLTRLFERHIEETCKVARKMLHVRD